MISTLFGKRAVVIGAGMSGLTVARGIADHFERVILLERDTLPSTVAHRSGTAQSKHAHILLGGGERALSELFPGFREQLFLTGAISTNVGLDIRLDRPGYDPFPRRDLGLLTFCLSRPLLELTTRKLLERHPNITLIQNCRVHEILATPDGASVTGIRCTAIDGRDEILPADLVIDASGRGFLTLSLLRSIGSPLPIETNIGVNIGYSTVVFAVPDNTPADWRAKTTVE